MNNFKKLISMALTLCFFSQILPAIVNANDVIKKIAMTEAGMATTMGGLSSLDANISSNYKDGAPVSAVVANRTATTATYVMESMDIHGNNVMTLASGDVLPGTSQIISATPPSERYSSNWAVRVRISDGSGLKSQDVVAY